jgi:hypothetical protein
MSEIKLGYYTSTDYKSRFIYKNGNDFYYKSKGVKVIVDIDDYEIDHHKNLSTRSKEELIEIILTLAQTVGTMETSIEHLKTANTSMNTYIMCNSTSNNGVTHLR